MKPTLSDLDDFPVSPLFKRPDLNMGHRQNSGVPSLQRCQKYFKRLALAPYSESILSRKMVIGKLGGGSKFPNVLHNIVAVMCRCLLILKEGGNNA